MATQTSVDALPRRRKFRVSPVQALAFVFVGLIVFWLGANLIDDPTTFLDLFLVGLTIGMIYALIALGYSLVYGILELINFAHGDVFMLGGMMTVTLVTAFGLRRVGHRALLDRPDAADLGVLTGPSTPHRAVAYRPLRNAPRLAPLITAIGVSSSSRRRAESGRARRRSIRDDILPNGKIFSIGGVEYAGDQPIVFAVTIPVLLALVWLVQRTSRARRCARSPRTRTPPR